MMNKAWMSTAMAVLLWVSGLSAQAADDSPVLLSGHGVTVTRYDADQALLGLAPAQRAKILGDPTIFRDFLYELYTERRVLIEAKKAGLESDPEVKARIAQYERKALVNTYLTRHHQSIEPPDLTGLAKQTYLTEKENYSIPERVLVEHILLTTKCLCEEADKKARAEQLMGEIQGGADFRILAKENSEDPSTAKRGGRMPDPIARGQAVPEFDEAAFALKEPGDVSAIVKTRFGFHIIRLVKRFPASVRPYEEVEAQILPALRKNYVSEKQKEFTGDFFPDDTTEINHAQIGLMRVPPEPEAPPQ